MSNGAFVVATFVIVGLFALLFRDAFIATSDTLNDARCSIGMKLYCDKE